jgi:endogenous inhibitor of DNA gyrase (YacG/DUF329 family)
MSMARKRALHLRCPTCKKAVKRNGPEYPFCSERCRLIDLGKWASGAYVISSPVTDISDAIEEGNSLDSEKKS